jgi:hypothetical protein
VNPVPKLEEEEEEEEQVPWLWFTPIFKYLQEYPVHSDHYKSFNKLI